MNKNVLKNLFISFSFFIITLFSCTSHSKEVNIIGTWGGNELKNFLKVCDALDIKIKFETTRDIDALITTRISANNLPDIAVLPNPAKLHDLIKKRKIKSLDFIDKNNLLKKYSKTWIDLASYGGKLYGIFYKTTNKSIIWYNPKQFKKNNWKVPKTWEELISLTDKIRKEGKTPWSIGADIGWPLSDWIENIFVRTAGPEKYQDWINHKIPWTDPLVKKSFIEWKKIVGNPKNLYGGIDGTLSSSFQNAAYVVFRNNPGAYLYFEGDFISSIVTSELDNIKLGIDINFFPFPPINNQQVNPVIGGADLIVIFKDNSEVKKLIKYLTTEKAHEIWVKNGGFISQNKNVSLDIYPDNISKSLAKMMINTDSFVFDASDMMPPGVGNQGGFWDACKRFIQNPDDLENILNDMEKLANDNY